MSAKKQRRIAECGGEENTTFTSFHLGGRCSPRIVQEANELFTVLNLVRGGVGVSLVLGSANLMHVPNVRLLDTGLDEAKWKIGLAWARLIHWRRSVHNL